MLGVLDVRCSGADFVDERNFTCSTFPAWCLAKYYFGCDVSNRLSSTCMGFSRNIGRPSSGYKIQEVVNAAEGGSQVSAPWCSRTVARSSTNANVCVHHYYIKAVVDVWALNPCALLLKLMCNHNTREHTECPPNI